MKCPYTQKTFKPKKYNEWREKSVIQNVWWILIGIAWMEKAGFTYWFSLCLLHLNVQTFRLKKKCHQNFGADSICLYIIITTIIS